MCQKLVLLKWTILIDIFKSGETRMVQSLILIFIFYKATIIIIQRQLKILNNFFYKFLFIIYFHIFKI